MPATKITYADKVGIVAKTTHINQVWDDDMNAIKIAINTNADILDTVEQETDVNTLAIADLENKKAFKNNIEFKTDDYIAIINDYIVVSASSVDIKITLPTAIGVAGQEINVTKADSTSFNIIVDTTSGQTIIGSLTQTISKQWSNATFVSTGANWVVK